MTSFFKKHTSSSKLLINHKISLIHKQLEDLKDLLIKNPEDEYSREYIVVFNTLISLENIRLYKLIDKNSSSYINSPSRKID